MSYQVVKRKTGYTIFNDRRRDLPTAEKILSYLAEKGMTKTAINWLYYYPVTQGVEKPSLTLGKRMLGIQDKKPRVSYDEIRQKVEQYWPRDLVKRFMAGEDVILRHISGREGFEKAHRRQYRSAQRTFSSLGGIKYFMDEIYPGLYKKLTRRTSPKDIDTKALGTLLRTRFYAGLPISRGILEYSEDPKEKALCNTIRQLGRTRISSQGFTETISRVSGLKKYDVEVNSSGYHASARLAEKLAALVFAYTPLLRIDTPLKPGELHLSQQEMEILQGEEKRRADLRVGNQAIEVKTLIHLFEKRWVEKIIETYPPGLNNWTSGEPLESSLLIFNARASLYKRFTPQIEQAGIQVMGYSEFHSLLEAVLKGIKTKFPDAVREVRPRIHTLDYIAELHEEIALHPHLITRPGNSHRLKWSSEVVTSLINKAGEIENAQRA